MVTRRWWPQEFETLKAQQAAEVEAETQAAFALAASGAPAPGRRPPHREEGNWAPATEAYLWGYPLLSIQRTRKLLCSRTRPGVFKAILTLATPRDRAVVVPNNDTLYASGWYDLRQGDLELAVPPWIAPDAIGTLMVVDAYTRVSYSAGRITGWAAFGPGHLGSGGRRAKWGTACFAAPPLRRG